MGRQCEKKRINCFLLDSELSWIMKNNQLKTIQPATRWEDALPIGNGNTAALVYGNITSDTIVLNHETFWIPQERIKYPDISENLPELRQILDHGQWTFSDQFLNIMFREKGVELNMSKSSYHPACDLKINTETHVPFSQYLRWIDMETGVCQMKWNENEKEFHREYFVSRKKDLVCIRCWGDEARSREVVLQPRDTVEENSSFKNREP